MLSYPVHPRMPISISQRRIPTARGLDSGVCRIETSRLWDYYRSGRSLAWIFIIGPFVDLSIRLLSDVSSLAYCHCGPFSEGSPSYLPYLVLGQLDYVSFCPAVANSNRSARPHSLSTGNMLVYLFLTTCNGFMFPNYPIAGNFAHPSNTVTVSV